jgi:ankyrin repeat protein
METATVLTEEDSMLYYLLGDAVGAGMNLVLKYITSLVSNGADVNEKGEDGCTPLHLAASNSSIKIVKFLVSNGADVNAKLEDGMTPLHLAAGNGYLKISKFLVSKMVDVNAEDNKGYTPLHLAVSNGYIEVAKFLVSEGADIRAEAMLTRDCTPLDIARNRGNTAIIEYLSDLIDKTEGYFPWEEF